MAQSVQGQWSGKLTQMGAKFNFYLDITENDGRLTGISTIVDMRGDSARIKFEGVKNKNKINIKESSPIFSSKTNGRHWCMKTMNLKYSKNSKGQFLVGEWVGSCSPGTISLTKNKPEARPLGDLPRKEIKLNKTKLVLFISDDRKVDGDIVTIMLNGKVVLDSYPVVKKPKKIKLKLATDTEYELVFIAENEGETPPNTALVVVKTGSITKKFHMKADLESNDVIYLLPKIE
jgi:hypothetical protein